MTGRVLLAHRLTNIGLILNATDNCPDSQLTVKLTIWADEGYAPSYVKPWTASCLTVFLCQASCHTVDNW